jgi:hypothetical protein
MIEIPPSVRPPLAMLLSVLVPLAILTGVLLLRTPRTVIRRLVLQAAAAGLLLTVVSGVAWSRRHAGMGTETAYGFPRVIYSRWESFEGDVHRSGFHSRWIMEAAFTYGVCVALVLVTVHRRRSVSMR